MTSELKVGVVGAPRGRSFIKTFQMLKETSVTALCDTNPDVLARAGDEYGVAERYTDYDAMLDSGVDAVVVSTPMNLHAPMAVAALDRNIHVLSEVTAATDLQQCCDLVDAVRGSSAKYMMAENYCYIKWNVLIREMVRQGMFGDIYFGEGEYVHELKAHCENTPWRKVWQVGKNGCTYGTHSLGPALYWFDERVVSVACFGTGHHYGATYKIEDTIIMMCKLASGGLIKIRFDLVSDRPHGLAYYALQGTRACYEAPRGMGDDHKIWLADVCRDMNEWRPLSEFETYLPAFWRNPPAEALESGHWGGDYFEVRDFIDAIVGDTEPPIDLYRALDFTVPGLISERSIEQGGMPLPVPDFREYVTGSKNVPGAIALTKP